MLVSGNQLKAARALLGIDQIIVSEKSGLNINTIRNMEASGPSPIAGRSANVQLVQRVLESLGIEFLNHGQSGVKTRGLVYRLDAISVSPDDPAWATSGQWRRLWTRADNPQMARANAKLATSVAGPLQLGTPGVTSPWELETHSTCVWDTAKNDVPFGAVVDLNGGRIDKD